MDAQMAAAERAARHKADPEAEKRKELEEPLLRGLTRGPDGLSAQELMKLVQNEEHMRQIALFSRALLRGGRVVVLKKGAS